MAELTWHWLTCLNKGDVNELNSTLQADNAAGALAVRRGTSLICFNSVAIWVNARRTLVLKPIKFWMHEKSFSYAEWPEPTKRMLTIHNADSWPNVLIQPRWPTINFESIIYFHLSHVLGVLPGVNLCSAFNVFTIQFQRDFWQQALCFPSGLNSELNEIIQYVQYSERHAGNVNCFLSPCCLVPAVLIKCKDNTFLCVMRDAFLTRVVLIWQKGKHEQRKGRKKKNIHNLKRPFIAFPKDPFCLDWSLLPRRLLTGAWPYSLCGTCSVNWFVNLSQWDAGFAKRLFLKNREENYIASHKQELLVISLANMFINCKRSFWFILIHIENS